MYLLYRKPKRPTRLLVILLMLWGMQATSQDMQQPLSLSMQDTNLSGVLSALDKQTAFTFSYDPAVLSKVPLKDVSYKAVPLSKILEDLKARTGMEYSIQQGTIAFRPGPAAPVTKTVATLTGHVVDEEDGKGIPGVTIKVVDKNVISHIDGSFSISVSPGKHHILLSSVGYEKKEITDVVLADKQVLELNLTLKRQKGSLSSVVVQASARKEGVAALYSRQKNNTAISDGISAEQIRVTPDNNTAQVLRRVSGITIQSEKFVTVRGVSDRYNNVLINGASLPSTEPNRRNFSFDIVPSALVDNIVVNKTATPDLPGEFSGGLIQINTKDIPSKNFLEVTIGTGLNTASDGKGFLSFKRDPQAWLGKVGKDRKWFGDGKLIDPTVYGKRVNIQNDTAFRNATGGQLPNRWKVHQYTYSPVHNFQLNGGMAHHFAAGNTLGFVGTLTYRNEMLYEEGDSRVLQQSDFDAQRYRYTTTIGGLFNVAYKTKKHKLAWKNIYNRKYSDQFDQQVGAYISDGWYSRRRSQVTLTNDLLLSKLEGEHNIGKFDLKADWYGEYIQLIREQPDTRFITGQGGEAAQLAQSKYTDDGRYTYDLNNPLIVKNGLYASRLEEIKKNAGLNLSLPFLIDNAKQLFKTGYGWSERSADFDGTGFKIREVPPNNSYINATRGLPYEDIAIPEAFSSGKLEYFAAYTRSETTGDRYEATQQLQSGYGMLDLKFFKKLRVIGGARYEQNKITISTVQYNNNGHSVFRDTSYYEKDWLPSVNLVYSFTDKLNIRAAYSKTLARPDFVERSPYVYYDFVELAEVVGQYALKTSRIQNYDLRLEYYPGSNEILSASLFYKKFQDPVERFYVIGSAMNTIEYRNMYEATAKGVELDARKSLGFIAPNSKWLQRLYISGNYTFLEGGISYFETKKNPVTNKDTLVLADADRPIQGLSPYIINGGLNYQGDIWGFNIAYNRTGRRIVNGGTHPTLIQYENPRDVVDLQLSGRFLQQKLEVKLNVSDLLNQYFIVYCNNINGDSSGGFPGEAPNKDPKGEAFNEEFDLINYKVKKGVGFSINFTYKF